MKFHIYGLLIGIGTIIVINSLNKDISQKKYSLNIQDYTFLLLFTLIEARGIYLLHNLQEIHDGTVIWWNISDGGLSFYGALLGLFLSAFVISKIKNIPSFFLTDSITRNLPLAQSIGRFGNYFNYELYGKPSNLPWSIFIPPEKRIEKYLKYSTFHPVFIYESILNFISWLILNKTYISKNNRNGTITGIYLFNYGIIRLFMNTLRIDKEYFRGIETSDLASVLAISLGIIILIINSSEKTKLSIAKIFSNIFNGYITLILPILIAVIPSSLALNDKIIIAISTAFIPISVFSVLKVMGKVSDFDMTKREERPFYCISTTLLLGIVYLFARSKGDQLLTSVCLNTFLISSTFTVITLFWKISGHMTYLTMTFCSLLYIISSPYILLFFPILPFTGWSRIKLKKHDIYQVLAGFLMAAIISFLVFVLI